MPHSTPYAPPARFRALWQRRPGPLAATLVALALACLPPGPLSSAPARQGPDQYRPGKYLYVVATPLGSGTSRLFNGTGLMSGPGVFTCGPFPEGSYPRIGDRYNITGNPDLRLTRWVCVAGGRNSEFRVR